MLGLMQDWPLLCHKLIDHAAIQHGHREVVSRSIEGPIVRTTYAEIRARALRSGDGQKSIIIVPISNPQRRQGWAWPVLLHDEVQVAAADAKAADTGASRCPIGTLPRRICWLNFLVICIEIYLCALCPRG